ncbi:MAG: DUF1846 domain-containing protein [Eubacteriales bacterium]|nr:DUF1846 domain-containing protein [Eubacteriales bacterium]
MRQGFDNQKYLKVQSERILERTRKFGDKLYLEFGGKLFDDYHASRVLMGFAPDSKMQMLKKLKNDVEIIVVVNANSIESNKLRGDLGITYDLDVLRIIDTFRAEDMLLRSVIITRYASQPAATAFKNRLEALGINVYFHYSIPDYPSNIPLIMSEDGYGKNDYVPTERRLVVVTAPGPGSGKMAVCLSQIYHEFKRGVSAGYAKFETFPVWSLPLKHPVNLAYEAATADLNDVNIIDPFHLDAYGLTAVNYNRDVEIFPVLDAMFRRIWGTSPYKSPTDMGVNVIGECIFDEEAIKFASRQEIIRRYLNAVCQQRKGLCSKEQVNKLYLLMTQAGLKVSDRAVVQPALDKAQASGVPAAAIQLGDGRILTGKASSLLDQIAALILNALKALGGIPDEILLLSPAVIEPMQHLKRDMLKSDDARLHADEILLALSICAATNPVAQLALDQITKLQGLDIHTTVMPSVADSTMFFKLHLSVTSEPILKGNKLYQQ